MSVWIAKAVIQKTISFLPFPHKINYLFQRYVTKGVLLSDYLMDDKLVHCKNHLHYYNKYNSNKNFISLEIGTGWYPIVPVGLYLSGASEIHSIDISSLLTTSSVHDTIRRFKEWHANGKLAGYLPGIDAARLNKLDEILALNLPPVELLKRMNINIIVGDARKTNFADGKFDFINSNNTFEHIYPEILLDILKEFRRILKPDGVMSHQIDMSDHFAHLDKQITIYNYLQYSDSAWSWIDNSIQPQNRLRITDYRKLYEQSGHKILEEQNRPGNLADLARITPDAKYNGIAPADMSVSHALLVSKKG